MTRATDAGGRIESETSTFAENTEQNSETNNAGGKSSDEILKGSISSAGFSMIFQVVFRVISFTLNGIFIRNLHNRDILGILNVRLMLLSSTILFISREAFRRACISDARNHNWPQVVNLMWMTVPNTILWSATFCWVWLNWFEPPAEDLLVDYKFAVIMTGLGCVAESLAEPMYLFAQAFQYVKLKLFVDVATVIVKTGTLTLTVLYAPQWTIRAFAYGVFLASAAVPVVYAAFFFRELRNKPSRLPFGSLLDFLPRRIPGQSLVDAGLAQLTWGFFKQGVLKQLLTEGERYVMTVFSVLTFTEQGVYDVVNNLGSLAARFLFLPIEESSYFYFAQMLKRDDAAEKEEECDQKSEDKEKAAVVLRTLLRILVLIGAIVVVFGFSYSHLLLSLYGRSTLIEGGGVPLLRAHCVCVLLLGVNGVGEAYAFAAMSRRRLDGHNRVLVGLTVLFLGLSWLLSRRFGAVGFVAANCANMALRIAFSAAFIGKYNRRSEQQPLTGLVPSKVHVAVLSAAFAVTAASEAFVYGRSTLLHLSIGAVSGAAVLAVILWSEPQLRHQAMAAVGRRWPSLRSKKND